MGALEKDEDGVPLTSNGFYWSITHKPRYVAAVVSPKPVGIDLEEIRSVHTRLYERVAGEEEWELVPGIEEKREMFFRFWTAKESVMKVAGTGIKDLSRIQISQVQDEKRMVLAFQDMVWNVRHHYFDDHIAAITTNDSMVKWSILKNP